MLLQKLATTETSIKTFFIDWRFYSGVRAPQTSTCAQKKSFRQKDRKLLNSRSWRLSCKRPSFLLTSSDTCLNNIIFLTIQGGAVRIDCNDLLRAAQIWLEDSYSRIGTLYTHLQNAAGKRHSQICKSFSLVRSEKKNKMNHNLIMQPFEKWAYFDTLLENVLTFLDLLGGSAQIVHNMFFQTAYFNIQED